MLFSISCNKLKCAQICEIIKISFVESTFLQSMNEESCFLIRATCFMLFDDCLLGSILFRHVKFLSLVSNDSNVIQMPALRKVQRTSSGTFFVCLPKTWAKNRGLKCGSLVLIDEVSDHKLVLSSQEEVNFPSMVTLEPSPYLNREIIGNYLLGYDIVRVESKSGIAFDTRSTVKGAVDRLIGLEIVEEDYSSITLQCLLEPSGFPPEKILRRSYAIAASMHHDAVYALVNNDISLAKSVIARDDEGNRLYFLLVRILRTVIQNPSLSERLNVRPIECLDYRLVASLVEAIGDECVRIAQEVVELSNAEIADDIRRLLLDLHKFCFDAHETALEAFFAGDIVPAENVRKTREKIEIMSANIEKAARNQSLEILPQLLAASSLLRQIYEHSVDVADLVVSKKK